jgi:capsular polysaccharide export protein
MIVTASRGIARIPHLSAFLDGEGDCVVGWGLKPSGLKARAIAARKGMRCLLLEDGFLRSVGRGDPPLSLIVDDLGVYYDAGAPSRVEKLIAQPINGSEASRAISLVTAWRDAGLSKYNHAPDYGGILPERFVLVVDQTFGDAAIACGQADENSFLRMLDAALLENPQCQVLVKVHPDIFTHGKTGYFDAGELGRRPRVQMIADECHAVGLIRQAEALYTVTSQMGFEGLLWGKRVRCFGMPFYAGWGVTEDELKAPARRGTITLEQLVHGALIRAPRYLDPETGEAWSVEQAIAFAAEHRRALESIWRSEGFKPSEPPWPGKILHRLPFRKGRR